MNPETSARMMSRFSTSAHVPPTTWQMINIQDTKTNNYFLKENSLLGQLQWEITILLQKSFVD